AAEKVLFSLFEVVEGHCAGVELLVELGELGEDVFLGLLRAGVLGIGGGVRRFFGSGGPAFTLGGRFGLAVPLALVLLVAGLVHRLLPRCRGLRCTRRREALVGCRATTLRVRMAPWVTPGRYR